MSRNRCAGSKASRQTLPGHYDRTRCTAVTIAAGPLTQAALFTFGRDLVTRAFPYRPVMAGRLGALRPGAGVRAPPAFRRVRKGPVRAFGARTG